MKKKTMEMKLGHCALEWFPCVEGEEEGHPEEAHLLIPKTAKSIYQGIVCIIWTQLVVAASRLENNLGEGGSYRWTTNLLMELWWGSAC